jgi:hypothetical protein
VAAKADGKRQVKIMAEHGQRFLEKNFQAKNIFPKRWQVNIFSYLCTLIFTLPN